MLKVNYPKDALIESIYLDPIEKKWITVKNKNRKTSVKLIICTSVILFYTDKLWVWVKLDSARLYHFTASLYSFSVFLLHARTLFYLPFNLFFILCVPDFINQIMYFPRCTVLYKLLLWGMCVCAYFSVEVCTTHAYTEHMLNRQIQSRHTWKQLC